MLKSISAALAATLLLAAPALAATQDAQPAPASPPPAAPQWQVKTYPDLGFKAEFPAEPQRVEQEAPLGKDDKTGADQGSAHVTVVVAPVGTGGFVVIRMDFSKATVNADQLAKVIDAAQQKLKSSVTGGDGQVQATGGDGGEFIVQKDGKSVRARIYASGKALYLVVVGGDSSLAVTGADADRFMKSFALI